MSRTKHSRKNMSVCVCIQPQQPPSAINTNHVMLLSGIDGDFLSGIWKCGESGCSETPSSALSARNPPQKGFKEAARQRQIERELERGRERRRRKEGGRGRLATLLQQFIQPHGLLIKKTRH